MKGDDLSYRLLEFAARILRLVQALPKNVSGRHVGGQLVRCGTSAGSNYEEARSAESRADFIHKMSVFWKETRESWYWLRLIHHAQLIKPPLVTKLLEESDALSRILSSSLKTARKRKPDASEKV
jgi:four helix bundle protein